MSELSNQIRVGVDEIETSTVTLEEASTVMREARESNQKRPPSGEW